MTEDELANMAFDKQLDEELDNNAAQEAFDKKLDEEKNVFKTGLNGWLSDLSVKPKSIARNVSMLMTFQITCND